MISTACTACGYVVAYPDTSRGRTVGCPDCGARVVVQALIPAAVRPGDLLRGTTPGKSADVQDGGLEGHDRLTCSWPLPPESRGARRPAQPKAAYPVTLMGHRPRSAPQPEAPVAVRAVATAAGMLGALAIGGAAIGGRHPGLALLAGVVLLCIAWITSSRYDYPRAWIVSRRICLFSAVLGLLVVLTIGLPVEPGTIGLQVLGLAVAVLCSLLSADGE